MIESENWIIQLRLRIFRKKALTLLISTSNFETIDVSLNCIYRSQFFWLLANQQRVAGKVAWVARSTLSLVRSDEGDTVVLNNWGQSTSTNPWDQTFINHKVSFYRLYLKEVEILSQIEIRAIFCCCYHCVLDFFEHISAAARRTTSCDCRCWYCVRITHSIKARFLIIVVQAFYTNWNFSTVGARSCENQKVVGPITRVQGRFAFTLQFYLTRASVGVAFEIMGSEYSVADSVNVCVGHTKIAEVWLHISAGFRVSNNLTPHFFTGLVESLRICFNFLTENETFEASISLLNFFDFSGWQRITFAAFDIVFAHFRRVIKLNTKELGKGRVVVWDSFGSVVGEDLLTVKTITQWLAVCFIVFYVSANGLVYPWGSWCLKKVFAVFSLQMNNHYHNSSRHHKFGR